jgi:hypothetical protein
MGARLVTGVAATVTPSAAPGVHSGHVAGWIGVGGPQQGPGGTDEWLQAGLSTSGDGLIHLYYEVESPARGPRYVDLGVSAVGKARRVAVRQVAGRPAWWRVYVDGRQVTAALPLPGSEAGLAAVATGESWRPVGAEPGCNTFAYRFHDLRIAAPGTRLWTRFQAEWTLQNAPYAVERGADGFDAVSRGAA